VTAAGAPLNPPASAAAVRLTAAQARRLGVDAPAKTRTTRKAARGPYHTRCVPCGAEFTTVAAEDRHLAANPHYRYEIVL
jgi:hypothetical protein